MAENQNSQGDKGRKTRPFGSFVIFLTVLILVMVAFGQERLRPPTSLTQDVFEWYLYTGRVVKLETVGANEVRGLLDDKKTFEVSYASLAEHEGRFKQVKADGPYGTISQTQLERIVKDQPHRLDGVRHLTGRKSETLQPAGGADPDGPPVEPIIKRSQEDKVFVSVTANSGSALGGAGHRWLEVTEISDLVALTTTLKGALPSGVRSTHMTFDLDPLGGTKHSEAGMSLTETFLLWGPWVLIFGVFLLFMRQMRQQGSGAGVMSFGRSRAQLYSKENHTNTTFDDVAGADEAKDEVREVVEFLKNPGRFTRIGGRIPRGVLLVGAPGCGKTLLAKAIAGEAEVPFFSISGSDFVEMFVGVGASRVRDLFKQARENSPCIIFLDEIDAVGRRRGSGMGGGHDEREQTLNAILVEMDGFGTDEGIILVAATNRPDVLDPALLRPGRFDREVTIDLPDMEGRTAILKVHLKKVKLADGVDVPTLARSTPGYSGADLAAIVNEAAIMAVLDKKETIEMKHLEECAAKVRYGRQKKSRKIEEEDRKITAYHEAGHTIIGIKIEDIDTPHKVTIVPRGRALGSTMLLPERESYHMQKNRLLGQLAMLFGGRVAEEVFCGDISAGASDDIKRATELARAMVTELGMSEKIGPINYAERQGSDFLGTELMSGKWHSEDTARAIDEEIERILREAYDHAREIVKDNREGVEKLMLGLMEFETINADEIKRLVGGVSLDVLREERKAAKDEPAPTAPPVTEPSSEARGEGESLRGDLSGEAGLSPA